MLVKFYQIAAYVTIALHMAFIFFVVAGGFFSWRWPKIFFVQFPVAVYGALIEFIGWDCPLTIVEKYLRELAGEAVYHGDFVTNYFMPLIMPESLMPHVWTILGTFVIIINLIAYTGCLIYRRKRRRL